LNPHALVGHQALNLCEPFLPRSRESAVVCLRRPAPIPSGTATGGPDPSREDRETFLVEPEHVSVRTFG
jgi:hypothetical protein